MTAGRAVLTAMVTALLGAPASASAADLAVDQGCYAEGGAIAVTGSGYTPGASVTLTLGDTTSSVGADETGDFSTSLSAPSTTLKHPGAQPMTLTSRDTASGEETTAAINVAKAGIDATPAKSKPHRRITWNLAGFPGTKPIYGHWRIHGRTRGHHRMGVPKGPCGVLHVKARQIEAKRVRFGIWTVQFDFNRRYDRHATPRATVKITVLKTFA